MGFFSHFSRKAREQKEAGEAKEQQCQQAAPEPAAEPQVFCIQFRCPPYFTVGTGE